MSDDFPEQKFGIEAKSSEVSDGGHITSKTEEQVESEIPEQELYHAKSFWTRWVFCQDAKVIGVQYALTATAVGLIGLVLSWGMRLQLRFS